jgi:hypothetical protein
MLLQGKIVVSCPAMLTTRVSRSERKTSEISAYTEVTLPGGDVLRGSVIFPECRILKKFGLLWQVEQVTAKGFVSGNRIEITLVPEWTFGPLALPCKASGFISMLPNSPYINMVFPWAWSTFSGPGKWTVNPVVAYGSVT